jgi:uncharacterized protein
VTSGTIDVSAVLTAEHGAARGPGLAGLVRERERQRIRLALAHSEIAIRADADTGNALAAAAAADPANGLAWVAVVGPTRSRDPERTLAAALRGGAVAVRLELPPGGFGSTAGLEAVLAAIGRAGRPLLIPLASSAPFGEASRIGAATASLGIPIVLVGAHYGHAADDVAAAARYEHLYLETSSLAHYRAVETTVARIGAERLLLGTGSPRRAAAAPIGAILGARVPDADKRAILGLNACRLFDLPPGEVVLGTGPAAGPVWDVHGHLGPFAMDVPAVEDRDLASELALTGITRVNVSSAPGIFGDPGLGNAQMAVACAADDRLRGYVVADTTDLDFTEAQLRRYLDQPGVVGVKVHAEWNGVDTAAPATAALFRLLARFGRPVKIHNAGHGWAPALQAIARDHPRLPIIIAHGGPGTPVAEGARVAAQSERVYIELASSFADLDAVRASVAIAGPERVLFGSDAPLLDPAFVLGTYADADLPAGSEQRIRWENAAALFGES